MELSGWGELPTGSWNHTRTDLPKVIEIVGLPGFEADCSGTISNSLPLACDRERSVCAPSHGTEKATNAYRADVILAIVESKAVMKTRG